MKKPIQEAAKINLTNITGKFVYPLAVVKMLTINKEW
jgi:hypothetical protein